MGDYTKDDIRNYSVEENFSKLEELIGDNPELWSDRYMMGTGQQLLRVICAGQSITGVKTLLANRETFSGTMGRMDSLLGYAETMGYSAPRGVNEILELEVQCNANITISERQVIGSVLGTYSLTAYEDLSLKFGEVQKIKVKVGNVKEVSQVIPDTSYRYVRFVDTNISDDIVVYKNGEIFPHGVEFKDLLDEKCAVITNAYGGVDIWFLNFANSPIQTGDTWTVNYLEYTNVDYTVSDIKFNYGTIISATQFSASEIPATKEDIRVSAPVYRDGQREDLAQNDALKLLRSELRGVKSVNVTPLNTVHSFLTYYYEDRSLLNRSKILSVETSIAPRYYFGYCPSTIEHPVLDRVKLQINVLLQKVVTDNIYLEVDNIIKSYENLETAIDLLQISYLIEGLTDADGYRYVKQAETLLVDTTSEGDYYSIGDIFTEDEKNYRVRDFLYNSGSSVAPLEGTDYLVCGDILLRPYRLIFGAEELKFSSTYTEGSIVKYQDNCYQVMPSFRLGTVPDGEKEVGGIIHAGDFEWLVVPYIVGDKSWGITDYAIKGERYQVAGEAISLQLIGFRKLKTQSNLVVKESIDLSATTLVTNWNYYNFIEYDINVEVA